MKEYVIGVDSGGTSTVASAYDLNGVLLMQTKGGFGNLLIDQEIGLQNIKQTVAKIVNKLGDDNCKAIVLGVAGVDSGNFKQTILDAFSSYSAEIIVLNDAWLAYYALLNGQDGCLIISGTGSILIGRSQGKEERVGGWGNLLGDQGSGFDIAKNLIMSILSGHDKNRPLSRLEQKLFAELDFETPFELVKFVYSSSKDEVANLSLFIAEEAERKDKQAIALLEKAGEDLGKQTILLLKKMDIHGTKKIAVTGNVLLKNDTVYRSFQNKVLEKYKDCEFMRRNISNTVGGYYYFKNQ